MELNGEPRRKPLVTAPSVNKGTQSTHWRKEVSSINSSWTIGFQHIEEETRWSCVILYNMQFKGIRHLTIRPGMSESTRTTEGKHLEISEEALISMKY